MDPHLPPSHPSTRGDSHRAARQMSGSDHNPPQRPALLHHASAPELHLSSPPQDQHHHQHQPSLQPPSHYPQHPAHSLSSQQPRPYTDQRHILPQAHDFDPHQHPSHQVPTHNAHSHFAPPPQFQTDQRHSSLSAPEDPRLARAADPAERAHYGLDQTPEYGRVPQPQYQYQQQHQYQHSRQYGPDQDFQRAHGQEANPHNVLGHTHIVNPLLSSQHELASYSFVLPPLATLPPPLQSSTSLPPTPFSSPQSTLTTTHTSSPFLPSSTFQRHRSRTLSSVPVSSFPLPTSSNIPAQHITAAPSFTFESNVHSSAHYLHPSLDPDSIPRRKRGRGSHPGVLVSGDVVSHNSARMTLGPSHYQHKNWHSVNDGLLPNLSSSLQDPPCPDVWMDSGTVPTGQAHRQAQHHQPAREVQPPLHFQQQPSPQSSHSQHARQDETLRPSALRRDNLSSAFIPGELGQNKRPFALSPPATIASFDAAGHFWHQAASTFPNQYQHYWQHQHQQHQQQHEQHRQSPRPKQVSGQVQGQQGRDHNAHEHLPEIAHAPSSSSSPMSRTHPPTPFVAEPRPTSITATAASSSTHAIPMPHFRTQLVQPRSSDSSYMRRFYTPSPASSSPIPSSVPRPASADLPPTILAQSARKHSTTKRRLSNEAATPEGATRNGPGFNQDVPMAVGTLLGRLLISTKQHVRYMLDSYIHSDQRDLHPNLERVLIELLNGMLQSHGAFATRDNLSSQEQPMTFRPTAVRSLSHLRDLLSATSVPSHLGTPLSSSSIPSASSKSPARSTQSEMPHLMSSRQRSSPLPPSRLSESTLYPGTTDTDAEMYADSGVEPHQSRPTAYDDQQAEVYNSTVEFLALMTAFVSVVCWLMQRMLDHPEGMRDPSGTLRSKGHGDTGRDMDLDQDTNRRQWTSGNRLRDFLDLFNDRDNVLRPIGEALAGGGHREGREAAGEFEFDPTKQVGLFAWHFYLFGSDPEGPLIKDGGSISGHALRSLEFDVILNELYTTHILSMTVKEHQKDHGQFYTPPAVVDFMWKRTIKGYGNLLARFMDVVVTGAQGRPIPQQSHGQSTPLIPIALDPCLGVSTFLSCYIRMLIQEARTGHGGVIWDSAEATSLLLREICEHIWGIELDGFAFWMARCGVLAALIPLVQRVQELSQAEQSATPHHSNQEYSPRTNLPSHTPFSLTLPRLHLFRNDTLQLLPPADLESPHAVWERDCILRLRNPARLIFDFIVTNPPYMIRKTGTFSAPDPEVYDWTILGSGFAPSTKANVGGMSTGGGSGSNTAPLLQVPKTKLVGKRSWDSLGDLAEESNLSAVDTGEDSETDAVTPESRASAASVASSFLRPTTPPRSGAKGMMQAYGYFIWFAAQRIKPYTGIACMITASQWLTLEFATKLRAWLFENCLMDEFFQFEPFKVFSKIQTDSLIFKIRALDNAPSYDPQRERLLQEHTTVFLRHTDHHRPLAGILQDYMEYSEMRSSSLTNDLSIMVSSKSRQELSAIIVAPSPASTPSISGLAISGNAITKTTPTPTPTTFTARTYSFAPMMPSSDLTTHLLTLTQGLGGICSAGTKKMNRLNAAEPLLWHRGPNTNPVYGLVVRMEYARATFGEVMTERWFRPTMYWNGKNYPEENAPGAALHKEGMFWQGRDRLRLSKKEGSPAESYLVPIPDPQRSYALCMVDKESIKLLRQQMQENVAGAQALWSYLTDVKTHFQPGLLATLKRKVNLNGKQQGADNEGVAYCSTNQCGSDVPEKIVHPINYGYFSKTQPRQRFFLDTDSQAVTNQCIYLTLNVLSRHYDAQHSASLIYFLTLLNSSTLQFFVLHFCQYDQQGRMRLFRESMAKIPFQSKDIKNNQERTQYASQLGEMMMELKKLLYQAVTNWRLTGSHHHQLDQRQGSGRGWQGSTGISSRGSLTGGSGGRGYESHRPGDPLLADGIAVPAPSSGGGNHGLLDWIRRGGDAPTGVLVKTKEQIRRMLMMAGVTPTPPLPHHTPSISQSPSPLSLVHGKRSDALMADADADTNPGTDSDSEVEDTLKARAQEPYLTVNHQSAEHPLNWTEHPRIYGSTSGRFSSEVTATDRFIPAPTFEANTPVPIDHRQQIHQHGDMDPRMHQAPQSFQNQFHPPGSASDDGRVALVEAPYLSPDSAAPYRSPLVASPAPSETRPTSATPPPPPPSSSSLPSTVYFLNYTTANSELSNECDRIMQSIERAIAMVEMVQWAVDQYGYMLYGIRPKFQKLLELELKLVYGSVVESVVVPRSPVVGTVSIARLPGPEAAFSSMSSSATSPFGEGSGAGSGAGLQQQQLMTDTAASRIGINILELHRWDGDGDDGDEGSDVVDASGTTSITSSSTPATGTVMGAVSGDSQQQHASKRPRHPPKIPSYATLILENAQTAAENLKQSLQRYKPFSGIASEGPLVE